MAGQATFHIDERDHLASLRAANVRQLRSRRFLIRITTLSIVAASVLGGILFAVGEYPWTAVIAVVSGVIGGLAALALLIGLTWLLLPRRARRLYRQNRLLQRQVTARWSDAGLEWETSSGHTRLGWDDVHAWQSDTRVTLVYLTDLLFRMIPAHALDSDARQDLVATLARHAPHRR
ncbi:YcxB family protein [Sphingomonas sp. RP10(2022)]|uniref:YcxB family protein n=1 Tax=Sphingomonas liriopis TaxID=2949094 RepID=A0A9X2HWK6_9SPHN|nr:YcxB family protein [Sphingomonas liriopis]MCP3734120.1 YcxB family protein [Sphingomonas liriopis]